MKGFTDTWEKSAFFWWHDMKGNHKWRNANDYKSMIYNIIDKYKKWTNVGMKILTKLTILQNKLKAVIFNDSLKFAPLCTLDESIRPIKSLQLKKN